MSQMHRSTRRAAIAFLIVVFMFGMTAFAQTTVSTVNGSVKDERGAFVPGARVTLIDMATNREVTNTTNDEGAFVFTEVRSGEYVLVAEATGFKRTETRGVKVNVGVPATVHLELQTGGVSETVTTIQ